MMCSGTVCTLVRGQLLGKQAPQVRIAQRLAVLQRKSCKAARVGDLAHRRGHEGGLQPVGRNTPMPGWGLSLILWNMPRISAVALTGDTRRRTPPARASQTSARCSSWRSAFGVRSAVRASFTRNMGRRAVFAHEKPRFLRASPALAPATGHRPPPRWDGLTRFARHWRTDGRRDPDQLKRPVADALGKPGRQLLGQRLGGRSSTWGYPGAFVYWPSQQYRFNALNDCIGGVLVCRLLNHTSRKPAIAPRILNSPPNSPPCCCFCPP